MVRLCPSKNLMLPFELIVVSTPISANLRKKNPAAYQSWILTIRQAAIAAWTDRELPVQDAIGVEIIYFYATSTQMDADNLIKPVLDALNQVVYDDDYQVVDILCRKRLSHPDYRLASYHFAELTERLSQNTDFIYIRVHLIQNQEDLRQWQP